MTKDLLPAARGGARPNSHSVFNTLILDDDPLDGSRSLRKRKTSSEAADEVVSTSRKRRRNHSQSQAQVPEETDEESPSEDEVEQKEDDRDEEGEEEDDDADADDDDDGEDDENAAVEDQDQAETAEPAKTRRQTRPARAQPTQHAERALVWITSRKADSLKMIFKLDTVKQQRVLRQRPKPKRRKYRGQMKTLKRAIAQAREVSPPRPAPVTSVPYTNPFYSFHDRENDELKSKPYGGILNEADADTSKTLPVTADRSRFEDARQKAEDAWLQKMAEMDIKEPTGRASQKVSGPPSKIKCISFGGFEIDTWYAAPYPEEYSRNRVLYICEFCLKYMNSDFVAWRHKLKCPAKHPPGDEIYRDGSVSVFEVDGRKNPVYCQNLCLLAKLFLGSKTLYYDVEPFLFYVMTEYDEYGCHFVGYFSKEKRPSSSNNVSCILTLPIHQRKGYGNLLIDFSYLLTRVERKTGSPEKPLSDMGLVSYRNYWRLVLSYDLLNQRTPLSITDISDRTGMTADDIVSALEGLRALVRDPVTRTYALRLDYEYLRDYVDSWERKGYVRLNPKGLIWTPYIMGRNNLAHYDHGPPLQTVAPREGEEDDEGEVEGSKQNGESQADNKDRVEEAAPLTNGIHPAAGPPSTTAMSMQNSTGSPSASPRKSQTPAPSSIPPTRYEVFPPIPGTHNRRRGTRPFGSTARRGATASARLRRATTGAASTTPTRSHPGKRLDNLTTPTPNSGLARTASMGTRSSGRTRSKLGEEADAEAAVEDANVDGEGEEMFVDAEETLAAPEDEEPLDEPKEGPEVGDAPPVAERVAVDPALMEASPNEAPLNGITEAAQVDDAVDLTQTPNGENLKANQITEENSDAEEDVDKDAEGDIDIEMQDAAAYQSAPEPAPTEPEPELKAAMQRSPSKKGTSVMVEVRI